MVCRYSERFGSNHFTQQPFKYRNFYFHYEAEISRFEFRYVYHFEILPRELGVDKFCVTNVNAINRNYERVVEIDLQPSDFLEFIGEYYSPELDTKYIVTANDSALFVKIPRNNKLEFSPFAKDEFSGNFFIQFSRGKRKKVEGFYLTTGRVRNLYFQKIKK